MIELAIVVDKPTTRPANVHETGAAPHAALDYTKFESVAAISADRALPSRLYRLLSEEGIESIFEGSVVYGVSVAPEQRERAIELLKADSKKHEYWIKF